MPIFCLRLVRYGNSNNLNESANKLANPEIDWTIENVPPVSVPWCGVSATTALQKAGLKNNIDIRLDEYILPPLPWAKGQNVLARTEFGNPFHQPTLAHIYPQFLYLLSSPEALLKPKTKLDRKMMWSSMVLSARCVSPDRAIRERKGLGKRGSERGTDDSQGSEIGGLADRQTDGVGRPWYADWILGGVSVYRQSQLIIRWNSTIVQAGSHFNH